MWHLAQILRWCNTLNYPEKKKRVRSVFLNKNRISHLVIFERSRSSARVACVRVCTHNRFVVVNLIWIWHVHMINFRRQRFKTQNLIIITSVRVVCQHHLPMMCTHKWHNFNKKTIYFSWISSANYSRSLSDPLTQFVLICYGCSGYPFA